MRKNNLKTITIIPYFLFIVVFFITNVSAYGFPCNIICNPANTPILNQIWNGRLQGVGCDCSTNQPIYASQVELYCFDLNGKNCWNNLQTQACTTGCAYLNCQPNWINRQEGSCQTNDQKLISYTDSNSCNKNTNLPSDAGWQPCDYCSSNIQGQFYTNWSACSLNDKDSLTKYYLDLNYNSCCAVTGLSSDCEINSPQYQNSTEYGSCDFCTPNWTANSICNADDSLSVGYNDSNSCFFQTNLSSDLQGISNNQTIPFSCDFNHTGFIGNISNVNSTLNLSFENSNGTINFVNENQTLFEFNSSNITVNFANLFIEKQPSNNSFAYLIVKGLDLTSENQTKTVYLNKILNGTGICIKDAELTFIGEISDSCTGSNEFWLTCPSSNGDYSCNLTGNNTIYQISGLRHSGVKEQATFCGDNICNGAETCSSCSIDCGICPSTSSGSSSVGRGGGGGGSMITLSKPTINQTINLPQVNETQNNIKDIENSTKENSSLLTGAVIGTDLKKRLLPALIIIVVLICALIGIKIIKKKGQK